MYCKNVQKCAKCVEIYENAQMCRTVQKYAKYTKMCKIVQTMLLLYCIIKMCKNMQTLFVVGISTCVYIMSTKMHKTNYENQKIC